MKRRAFTLIELMIVVAVIGIMVQAFWAPGKTLTGLQERSQKLIEQNQALAEDFLKLKKFNAKREEIREIHPYRVVFKDGATLILDLDHKWILLSGNSELTVIKDLKFQSSIKQLDARTYSFELDLNGEKINSHWRCGRDN